METTPYTYKQAFDNYICSLGLTFDVNELRLSLFETFIRNEFGLEPNEKNGDNDKPVESLKAAATAAATSGGNNYNLRPRLRK